MQNKVNLERAMGKRGMISRQNPITSISYITEDDKVKCGSFAFYGSDKEKFITGVKTGATEKDIAGFVVYGYQMNTGFQNGIDVLKSAEVMVVKKGYCFAVSENDAKNGDNVFVKPETGAIKTSKNDTEAGFIKTSWVVETGNLAGRVIEIANI